MMFNFIIDCTNDELPGFTNIKIEEAYKVFNRGDLAWCLQTYLILLKRGTVPVSCSNQLSDNAINIIHSNQLLKLRGNTSHFIVCVCADYPKRQWAHYFIVQNKNQVKHRCAFIPHWVQQGLIKRNPERKGISRIAYAGIPYNGNLACSTSYWEQLLLPYGIDFTVLTENSWHNMSAVDILVGIRSFDGKPYNSKPPTKLLNAWHANIPFIGGHDSAYKQVGIPGNDYLLAASPQEVISHLLQLRDNNHLYNQLLRNGKEKSSLYTEDTIANTWEIILTGPVQKRYENWLIRKSYEKKRFSLLLKFSMLENKVKVLAKKYIMARVN